MSDSPLLDHLLELRNRLLRSILVILLVFASLAYFANDIYHFVAQPLLSNMPLGTQMIATDVAAPFFTPFKLTLVVALIYYGKCGGLLRRACMDARSA